MLPLLDLELLRAKAEDLTAEAAAYRRQRIEPAHRSGRLAGRNAAPPVRLAAAPAGPCPPRPRKA